MQTLVDSVVQPVDFYYLGKHLSYSPAPREHAKGAEMNKIKVIKEYFPVNNTLVEVRDQQKFSVVLIYPHGGTW